MTGVVAVVGPGPLPDGCREASRRRATALGLELDWVEVADERAARDALGRAARNGTAVLLASGALADRPAVAAGVAETTTPVVHVDPGAVRDRGPVRAACDRVIHGRGRASFTWAVRWIATGARWPGVVRPYGTDHRSQVGELRLPSDPDSAAGRVPPAAGWPVVVLVHGGFWLDWWERDLMDGLAVALTRRGVATWNVEYRRSGPSGGGWPTSLEDACDAVDAVADLAGGGLPLDPGRVAVVGHSVGALLAVYATARERLEEPAPGRAPRVRPVGLVGLAGVLDLEAAAAADLGAGSVRAFLGDAHAGARARRASPVHLAPLGVGTLVVHGTADPLVPADHSVRYADLARAAGDDVVLELVDADHFAPIEADGPASTAVIAWLDRLHA